MQNRPWYSFPVALLLSVISAVLLAYALPPRDFGVLGWVVVLPLLVVALVERPVIVFFCGLVTPLVCAGICAGPISEGWQYGNLLGGFGSLGLVLACVTTIASLAHKKMNASLWPFFVACVGVTGELAATIFFPATIAITQHQNAAALRLSSITGIWGVTFLLWLLPAALVTARRSVKSAVPAFAVFGIVIIGAWVMPVGGGGTPISVAAVQAGNSADAAAQTNKLKGRAKIAVWPEILIRASSQRPSSSAKIAQVYVAADVSEPNPGHKPYNSVFFYAPSGKRIAVCRKRNLFGRERLSITPGESAAPVKAGGFCAGIPICYDTQFTGVVRTMVRRGADIILVPNHDPNLPNGLFQYLHSAVISFRAAENGVPVVWSESNSLSGIFDCDGKRLARAPINAVTAVTAQVNLRSRTTIYTRIGDLFAYLCVCGACVMLLMGGFGIRIPKKLDAASASGYRRN